MHMYDYVNMYDVASHVCHLAKVKDVRDVASSSSLAFDDSWQWIIIITITA